MHSSTLRQGANLKIAPRQHFVRQETSAVPDRSRRCMLRGARDQWERRPGGEQIGHFELLEKLGAGGMGVDYKARDTHLNRLVAIKVIQPARVSDSALQARLLAEARAASALNHPNVVTVYDAWVPGRNGFHRNGVCPGRDARTPELKLIVNREQ